MRPATAGHRAAVLAAASACFAALALVAFAVDRARAGESTGAPAEPPAGQADTTGNAGLPTEGRLRFGEDLGGVRLGASRDEVVAAWGAQFGRCRNCDRATWYFTYEEFAPEGVGVEFTDGRVRALFTLWKPVGWRSAGGLELGASRGDIPADYLELRRIECSGYEAYVHQRDDSMTVIYLHDDLLWAFALMGPDQPVCR